MWLAHITALDEGECMMDKYKELISVFSDVLEKSKDYHIAYIYQVGYVSLVGLLSKAEGQNLSMIVDEIFSSPEVMAESLLRNWRWQWFYENRELLLRKDYDDICRLDDEVPDSLQEQYKREILSWQDKIQAVLQKES
jgi:hypothetical protein